jgi:hypothetical protein
VQDARVVSGWGRRVDAGMVEATPASAEAGANGQLNGQEAFHIWTTRGCLPSRKITDPVIWIWPGRWTLMVCDD